MVYKNKASKAAYLRLKSRKFPLQKKKKKKHVVTRDPRIKADKSQN